MINAIVNELKGRFDADGIAKVTMKDSKNTVVTIERYEDFGFDGSDRYEVKWGFNNSYGKFCYTLEEVADVLLHFETVQTKQAKEKADLLDHIMELQLMRRGSIQASDDEISELYSFVSDWSKEFYHFRYRG